MSMFFGNQLKKIRIKFKFNQEDIADAVGVKQGQFSRYESGVTDQQISCLF